MVGWNKIVYTDKHKPNWLTFNQFNVMPACTP